MIEDFFAFITIIVMLFIISWFGYQAAPKIYEYTEKPFCQSREVNGKRFERCLIAVEVPKAKTLEVK